VENLSEDGHLSHGGLLEIFFEHSNSCCMIKNMMQLIFVGLVTCTDFEYGGLRPCTEYLCCFL